MVDDRAAAEHEALLHFVYQFPVAVLRMTGAGSIDLMNPRAIALLLGLGLPFEPDAGWELLASLDAPLAARARAAIQTPGTVTEQHPVERRDPQGRLHHLALTVIVVDADSCMVAIEDVTQRVEQERQLTIERRSLSVVMENIEGYFVASLDLDLRVIESNRSVERVLGYGADVVGRRWRELLSTGGGSGTDLGAKAGEAIERGWSAFEAEYVSATGDTLWGDTILATVVDEAGEPSRFIVVARDVTARRRREIDLVAQASSDALTGLLNRRGLAAQMAPWLEAASNGARPTLSALALDLDFFKRVNDTHGHEGGDEVLRHVGGMLGKQFRRGDLVARLGGEEFVVVLRDTPVDAAAALAERLRLRLEQTPVLWQGTSIAVTVSIGVATVEAHEDAGLLLRNADLALYRAKAEGRNRVVRF